MARPRTPTAVLERRGAFRHDPQRRQNRLAEPKPEGPLGDPPEHFTETLAAIWHELSDTCPVGVLTSADRWVVEVTCQLMAKLRTPDPLKGSMTAAEVTQLVACLSRMGMTPADRSRVGLATDDKPQPEADPWAEFASEFERPQ